MRDASVILEGRSLDDPRHFSWFKRPIWLEFIRPIFFASWCGLFLRFLMELSKYLFLAHYFLVGCFRGEVLSHFLLDLLRYRYLDLIDALKVFRIFIIIMNLRDRPDIAGSWGWSLKHIGVLFNRVVQTIVMLRKKCVGLLKGRIHRGRVRVRT